MVKTLSLKQMIFAGFGLVLVLLMALAAVSLRGTNTIGHDFTEYRQAARESLLVNDANATLLQARLAVMQYRVANSEETAQGVRDQIIRLAELKDELIGFVQDPSKGERIEELRGYVDEYKATFAAVVDIQNQRNALVPQMNQAGREARSVVSDLMGDANDLQNGEAAYLGGVVQQHLMLARYYAEKFLLENTESDRARTVQELRTAEEAAEMLSRFARTGPLASSFTSYQDNVASFEALFLETADLIVARNTLLDDQLDVLGPQVANGYAALLSDVVSVQNTVGPRAAAEVASISRSTMVLGLVAIALGIVAAFFIGRLISGAIGTVVLRMQDLAAGNLDIEITGSDRKDELGDMARALLIFQENGREKVRMQAEQEQQAEHAEAEKRRTMNEMADGFEASVNEVVAGVSSAAEQMVGLAQLLTQSAERAGERSTAVAAASEEASTNVETVAAASEEMTNSIAEVSQRVGQSATMTDEAARGAEETTATVSRLSTSAQTIGDVISMISDIAEQTNLLALNATIEAARAGEAGKGFAVVASEVKSLANQTAKATEEISAQITGMQGETDAVVQAIEKIGGMITELNGTSSSIAAAVEEQHSATQEIARNTAQAADGTREVSSNITEVSSAVQETGQAASEVLTASSQLAGEAERLREGVADFLLTVRAA
jgi:methyl-accepting chemotaxis protein